MMASTHASSSPIRLALVTTELRPGGAERCLTNLARGLDRATFAPQVYTLAARPPAGQTQLVDALAEHDVPVHFLGATRTTQLVSTIRRLQTLLGEQRPHLVQAFLFHANVASALATRGMNVPVFAGLRVAQPEVVRQFVERRLTRRFAGFVCVSQAVADHAARRGGLPREKLHVIPNGVDVDAWQRVTPIDWSELGVSVGRRVILFAARLEPQKGADILVEAAAHFLPQLPQHDVVLVGNGEERAKLSQRVERLALASRFHFAGWRPDVARCIAASDIVVLPSRYEGMSNVLLEAMAAGRPVVATKVEGTSEVLDPLAATQTCSPNDAAALASAVTRLALDKTLQESLGNANRIRVASHFSLEKMIDSYATLYRATA
jgi:starch synthase (maltosyl-transferring)